MQVDRLVAQPKSAQDSTRSATMPPLPLEAEIPGRLPSLVDTLRIAQGSSTAFQTLPYTPAALGSSDPANHSLDPKVVECALDQYKRRHKLLETLSPPTPRLVSDGESVSRNDKLSTFARKQDASRPRTTGPPSSQPRTTESMESESAGPSTPAALEEAAWLLEMVQTKSGNKAIQKPSTSNASYRTGPSTPAYSDAQRQLFDRPSSQPSISSSRYPIGRSHTMETRVGSPHQASATYQPTLPAGSSIPLRPQHRSISRNEDSRFSKPRAFAPPLPRPYTSVTSTDFQAAGKRPVSPMIQPGPSMRPSIREPESRVQFQDWASTSSLGATSTRQLSTAGSWGSSPRSSDLELPDEDREDPTASFRASEGRYACEFCAKKFARPSSLRIHRNSHTGERPFECLECPKKFSVLSNLRRHQKIHIKNKLSDK